MSNLSNSATVTLIFDDHSRIEVESFSLSDYAINKMYRVHLTLVEEVPQACRLGALAQIEWEHRGKIHYFPGLLSSIIGKSLELNAPLFLDSPKKTRYFHQRPMNDILKKLLADYPGEVQIQCDGHPLCDYSQRDLPDGESVLEFIPSQSAYLLWKSQQAPHLSIQSALPTNMVHTLIFGKYGIESPVEKTIWRWREFPKQQLWEFDTQDWLGELGECVLHPHLGKSRIIEIRLTKTRSQFPVITVITSHMDNPLKMPQKSRQYLPPDLSQIQEMVDSQGHYQTKLLHSEQDAYHEVPAVTLRAGGWHFPYSKEETIVQEYADSDGTPIILGSLIQGPAKTVQFLRTAGGLAWKIDDQHGMEWSAGHQTIILSPRKIQFIQAQGQLQRRACGSITSHASKTFKISAKQEYSQVQKQSLMTLTQDTLESQQNSFFTAGQLMIKTVGLTNWSIGQNAILQAKKQVTWQSPRITLEGNLQTQAKTIVIHTKRFECQAGPVQLRLDQDGLTLSARKIRCGAGILTQKGRQTLHANI